MPLQQAHVLYGWSYLNEPVHMFNGVALVNGGYAGREADDLLIELKQLIDKSKC